jgi:23S rRNA (guanosine2251-2'-O)-methyltransferase
MNIIYGINPVREAICSSNVNVDSVCLERGSRNPRLAEIRRLSREKGIPLQEIPLSAIQRLANASGHQGVVAQLGDFRYTTYDEILGRASTPGLLLILDGIEDPQNLGAIIRTADAAGVSGVFLPERRSASMTSAAQKASAGASVHVAVSRQTNLSRLIEQLQAEGYWVVGLDAAAQDLWTKPDYRVPTALVLGSEGHGIRPLVRQHCDFLVRLPMLGQVESLNVSVTAGIVLYEILRQRSAS